MSVLKKILTEVGEEAKRLGKQGQMEIANAIFNGSSFVPYGPGQWDGPNRKSGPDAAQTEQQKQIEEQSGGMEM